MSDKNTAKLSLSVAFCGIFTALAVVVMFASLIPSFAYAVPAAAGIVVWVVGEQLGKKWAYLSYIAAALLSFILVPEIEADFIFLTFFGYYPTLRGELMRIKSRLLRLPAKLAVFNAAIVLTYHILCAILSAEQMLEGMEEFGVYAVYILWAGGNMTFFVYDILLGSIGGIYAVTLKPRLRKLMKL